MNQFVPKLSNQITEPSRATLLGILTRARGQDLESVLEELDTIIGLDYASLATSVLGHWTNIERATAQRLRIDIEHEIIREYREIDAAKGEDLYAPLIDALFSFLDPNKHCLPVFTTNYDPAIEVFCQRKYPEYAIVDGFTLDPASRDYYWDGSLFDAYTLDSGTKTIVLFKLHGSVDWLMVKSNQRIRRGQAMYDGLDADAYDNVLIYPARRKIATDDPYYTSYEYYQRCCENAKVCLAIGYSFRDYDALTRLRGAASANEKIELALLSPSADNILKTVPISQSRKKALKYFFGDPTTASDYLTQLGTYLEGVLRGS